MSQAEQPSQDSQTPTPSATNQSERTLGMVCHLLALCMFTCFPFANIIAPLVLWLMKKEEYPFVDDQGKESINFQITMTLAAIALVPLYLVVIAIAETISPVFMIFGLVVWLVGLALTGANLVFIIIAAIKASSGEAYRYPFSLRLIK
jgi:uncharacterized protein